MAKKRGNSAKKTASTSDRRGEWLIALVFRGKNSVFDDFGRTIDVKQDWKPILQVLHLKAFSGKVGPKMLKKSAPGENAASSTFATFPSKTPPEPSRPATRQKSDINEESARFSVFDKRVLLVLIKRKTDILLESKNLKVLIVSTAVDTIQL